MKKSFHSLVSTIFAITISIIYLSPCSLLEANPVGFSVDLIHRDSPSSPLYNSSLSHFERVSSALHRSTNRVKYYTRASTTPQSAYGDVFSQGGEYLMKITIGTPPVSILAIADTGNDLIWTQCLPCSDCYKQKAPFFNPRSSSTYKEVPCDSDSACQTLGGAFCTLGICQYAVQYGDGSYSQGYLATEAVTLSSTTGRPVSLPNKIIFGCGYENVGSFSENGSGIIGLGAGPLSLISQSRSSIGDKFSYCLVPLSSDNTKSSQMNFGQNAIVSGNGVVSTPMTLNSFYFLTLEGISVGGQRLEFYDSSSSPNASGSFETDNMIIDSGTLLTFLPPNFYSRLESAVRSAIKEKPMADPQQLLDLCYKFSNEISFPIITAHFTGADVKLSHLNTFIETSSDLTCFAFAPAYTGVFGKVAQTNFLVGYDLPVYTLGGFRSFFTLWVGVLEALLGGFGGFVSRPWVQLQPCVDLGWVGSGNSFGHFAARGSLRGGGSRDV
ncbi:hypothetical protein TEA_021311 [Camellia sinensis var. sinensis]|uniref:Peptidase A1 domain-containing protein n=1 Tax=Camellia sinensis var. sinensis TaxID=542762 RepID=A0A4V3WRF1_CAMSN|nr:hypothetical protein TEA_021311 [Camellia sinensis var. sinensis]